MLRGNAGNINVEPRSPELSYLTGTCGNKKTVILQLQWHTTIWMFPKMGEKPQNGWWKLMENPIKMDDLGVPLFSETSIYPLVVPNIAGWNIHPFSIGNIYIYIVHFTASEKLNLPECNQYKIIALIIRNGWGVNSLFLWICWIWCYQYCRYPIVPWILMAIPKPLKISHKNSSVFLQNRAGKKKHINHGHLQGVGPYIRSL